MGELYQVDAFTERAFGGNPAAVVLLDTAPLDDAWMQALAGEMGLPATAFVSRMGDGHYRLRWFSPTRELELCGHGTLAAAHVLFELDEVRFETRSAGQLQARKSGDLIELDFPATPTVEAEAPAALLEGINTTVVSVERGGLDYIVELESEAAVRTLETDFARLRQLNARGIIVTARAETEPADFVSRFFAPSLGSDEDAVTGSAHCALGPYWSKRLNRNELVGVQLSKRRGVVHVTVSGERVLLQGKAVTIMRGRLASDALEQWRTTHAQLLRAFPHEALKAVEPPLVSTPGPR